MRPASVGFQCPDDVADGQRSNGRTDGLRWPPDRRSAVRHADLLALNVLAFIAQGFPLSSNNR